jgi:hypothetical protein
MKQKLMTEYFDNLNKKIKLNNVIESDNLIKSCNSIKLEEIIYGYNPKTNSWHCTLCGIDMGPSNPRQLCRKTYCENNFY